MQTDEPSNSDDSRLEAPDGLVSALKQLPQEPIFVPRTVDEAVLRATRAKLSPRQATERPWFWRLAPWLATAGATAALLAVVVLSSRTSPEPAFAYEDLNRDGQVDILDAFTLARTLRDNLESPPRPDFNGDGRTDAADVAWLSAAAVRLEKGDPS